VQWCRGWLQCLCLLPEHSRGNDFDACYILLTHLLAVDLLGTPLQEVPACLAASAASLRTLRMSSADKEAPITQASWQARHSLVGAAVRLPSHVCAWAGIRVQSHRALLWPAGISHTQGTLQTLNSAQLVFRLLC